jgi:hypothetical protein
MVAKDGDVDARHFSGFHESHPGSDRDLFSINRQRYLLTHQYSGSILKFLSIDPSLPENFAQEI